jgi:alpha-L-fucosidase
VRLLQPSFASDTLRVFDAQLASRSLKFGAGKTRDAYVTGWSNKNDFIVWPARLNQAASFEVEIAYDADRTSAGGKFAVSCGAEKLSGVVRAGTMQTVSLGRVTLKPGSFEIRLLAEQIAGKELMRPRSLTLKRVE